MCAAEHLRGVASKEGDRLDMDEGRQVDELLNYEELVFRVTDAPTVHQTMVSMFLRGFTYGDN